jgi:hypothetical protein
MDKPACAACGAVLITAIPNPPAIIVPIIANIFLAHCLYTKSQKWWECSFIF